MVFEIVQPFLNVLYAYPYLFIFVGMVIAGEVVLIPAIYLAATNRLDPVSVIILALIATLLSDLVWYYLGRKFPASVLERIPGRGTNHVVSGLESVFRQDGAKILFLSKFVYGTRTTVQILAGVYDMPFRIYIITNIFGILSVIGTLVLIAYSIIGTTHRLGDVMQGVEIAFLLFVLVAVSGYFLIGGILRRRWFQ